MVYKIGILEYCDSFLPSFLSFFIRIYGQCEKRERVCCSRGANYKFPYKPRTTIQLFLELNVYCDCSMKLVCISFFSYRFCTSTRIISILLKKSIILSICFHFTVVKSIVFTFITKTERKNWIILYMRVISRLLVIQDIAYLSLSSSSSSLSML